ncbi:MAG: sulfur carrier protein ThiS [Alcanivoracaceae bacterium]
MQLTVNGKLLEFSGRTIRDLLDLLDVQGRLAVEVNAVIVPKSEHMQFELSDGDVIEIVHAIGGG